MAALVCSAYAQYNTKYGTGTVSIGNANSFFGYNVGHDANASSLNNAFFGAFSGRYNTSGSFNSFFGKGSGEDNTTGEFNTVMGSDALHYNQTGSQNVAIGSAALLHNNANQNTAVGDGAMLNNTTGHNNVAVGFSVLISNFGTANTAVGSSAMWGNVTGSENTALGHEALIKNKTGYYNTATGCQALYYNESNRNTATGRRSLYNNTTGFGNTALGTRALYFITTGDLNTAVGIEAGPSIADLNNTTAIGYLAVPTASNQVRIGNAAVTSIGGQVEWTAFSDGRFKKDIKEDVSGLDFIKHLRPVSYVVDKTEVNKFLHVTDSASSQTETKVIPMRQTGFIAQEVEALVKKTGYVFSGVDAPKNENDPYGIRYATFVVPLVKAVQELSAKVEEQQQMINALLLKNDSSTEDTNSQGVILYDNVPNPFSTDTEIKMRLPEKTQQATVIIFNLEGKQLKSFTVTNRGETSVRVSSDDLGAGMYLYTLIADGKFVDTKRMILAK